MRVAYVLRYYPTLSETFITREIRAVQSTGVEVVVVAMGMRADGALARDLPDVPVLRPPRRRRVAWLVRRLEVDHVHAHFDGEPSTLARAVADRLGVPWTVTVHASDLFRPHAGITTRLRAASAVVTVCAHHRRWIARHHGVEADVVRCGVTLPATVADPGRQPARVVAVARDVPKKDLARLRRACPSARILSSLPHAEVLTALQSAQVFALPCRVGPSGDRDGVPVAMLEAMAAGLPVVTRPVSGIPELVDASVGFIDVDFERALAHALSDPDERVRRGHRGRERVGASWGTAQSGRSMARLWGRLAT